MLEGYLTPLRVSWYSASILFAIFLNFKSLFFMEQEAVLISGRLGGDYPAFYGVRHKAGKAASK